MVLSVGAKLLVVHRRLFESDEPRLFVGTVRAYEPGVAKVEGRSWGWHHPSASYVPKPGTRTKLVPIASGTLIVYELPQSTRVEALALRESPDRHLLLSDGAGVEVDLTERLPPPRR